MRGHIVSVHSSNFIFLRLTDDPGTIFAHGSELDFQVETAQVGDVIEVLRVEDTPKGPKAHGVTFIRRPDLVNGTITRIIAGKGFAFATPDDGGADVFVHPCAFTDVIDKRSATFNDLHVGDRVRFRITPGKNGPRAAGVERIA